jgi:hypothetical protein
MKIISGGQTGVDRAALDVAIERAMSWGGWCPKGGWAEDYPDEPGLLGKYPELRETPSSRPEQRTEWNVRDSDAVLIIADPKGLSVSQGTTCAHAWANHYGKPVLVIDVSRPDAAARAADWLAIQRRRFGEQMMLGIGGPRESEAPGIYASARLMLADALDGG